MARFNTVGLDDLISEMQRMGQDSGETAEAMVDAAVIEIRNAWRETAEKHGFHDTGAMISSIGFPNPAAKIGDMVYRDVYPQGKDAKGTRNAEKAFILHYGKSGLKASYWTDEADELAGPRVQKRLEEMWAEFLETGKVPTVVDADGGSGGGITTTTK